MKRLTCLVFLFLCVILTSCSSAADVMQMRNSCDTCKSYIVGSWYKIDTEGKLYQIEYREDGTVVNCDYELWTCACTADNHAIRIGGKDYSYGLSYYDPQEELLFESWAKDIGYTFVELTVDNWTEYFSENFYDVFEIKYELIVQENTNEWGETAVSHLGIRKYAVLKDAVKYGPLSQITLEFDCAYSLETATVDLEQMKLIGMETVELMDMHVLTCTTFASNGTYECTLPLGIDDNEIPDAELYVSLETPSEKIYRMKGILVVKE